ELLGVLPGDVGDVGLQSDGGIDGPQFSFRSHRLGQALPGIGFVIEHLTLQIALLYEIPVEEADGADAGADHMVGQGRAQRPQADDRYPGAGEPFLSRLADGSEQDLARIALSIDWHRSTSNILRLTGVRQGPPGDPTAPFEALSIPNRLPTLPFSRSGRFPSSVRWRNAPRRRHPSGGGWPPR